MSDDNKAYIQELPDGKYRMCTVKEIAKAKTAAKRREKLTLQLEVLKTELHELGKDCTHPVCWDEWGYIYTTRHCIICGHTSIL